MATINNSRAVAISVFVYERLLAVYPRAFRDEYGPAMMQLFRDQCRDASNESRGLGLIGLWLRVLVDLLKTSAVQHRNSFVAIGPGGTFWRVFVAAFFCVVAFSVCQTIWAPRLYSSTTIIIPEKQKPEDPYFVVTQAKIIESYSMLTNVIAILHLDTRLAAQAHDTNHWSVDKTYVALYNGISVNTHQSPSLIEISVKNQNPKLAADIANAIVATYQDIRREKWQAENSSEVVVLWSKLADNKILLTKMEEKLDQLKYSLRLEDPDKPEDRKPTTAAYPDLKRKIEDLRDENKSLEQTIQRKLATLSVAPQVVTVEPARPVLNAHLDPTRILVIWLFPGALAALGGMAWFAYLMRRTTQKPTASLG